MVGVIYIYFFNFAYFVLQIQFSLRKALEIWRRMSILFLIFIVLCVHMHAHVWHVSGGQRTA